MIGTLAAILPKAAADTGSDAGVFVFLLIFGGIGGLIGIPIARSRFRPWWLGFVLGFFLGWVGWIIMAVIPKVKGPPCVACGTPLQLNRVSGQVVPARVCMLCGAQQTPLMGRTAMAGQGVPPPPVAVG